MTSVWSPCTQGKRPDLGPEKAEVDRHTGEQEGAHSSLQEGDQTFLYLWFTSPGSQATCMFPQHSHEQGCQAPEEQEVAVVRA